MAGTDHDEHDDTVDPVDPDHAVDHDGPVDPGHAVEHDGPVDPVDPVAPVDPDGDDRDPAARGAARGRGVARHGRLRRRGPWRGLAAGVGLVAAVAVAGATSLAAVATWQVLDGAPPPVSLAAPGATSSPPPALTAQSGEVTLLLVGSDTREGQGVAYEDAANQAASVGVGKNDSTVLVRINADHTAMAVVSFPRDLLLPIPACTNDEGGVTPASSRAMLNTALERGGREHGLACVAATIGQLTGLQVDYAGSVEFDGVVAMADAVGGVEVCLATPLRDDDVDPALDLPAGTRVLTGSEAGSFLRSRHGVGDESDLARVSNQQTFLSALARQTVSAGTLTDPAAVLRLATVAFDSMTLSDTLADPATLARMALAIDTVGLDQMVFVTYPVVDDPSDPNRVVEATEPAAVLKAALQAGQPIELAEDSLGRSAVLDPAAPAVPAPPAAEQPGAPVGSTDPADPTAPATAAPAPLPAAELPSSVSGQSADQVTCAAKG